MQALQLHYTSCRGGRSGRPGFQVRTASPGLEDGETRQIIGRSGYTPPMDAPDQPTVEQIAQQLPRALRYYPLESGRWALTVSSYVGQDYSRRWGNFFAHTLVGTEGPIDRWPFDLYEWSGWCSGLAAEEDTEQQPPALPPVSLEGVPVAESFGADELAVFLREEPGREELLARMIRAVILGRAQERPLLVRDSVLNGLFWLACVHRAFPLVMARGLSLSSYVYDSRQCLALNATTGETTFAFDDTERGYQYYVFDLVSGRHSEIPEPVGDYAACVARWMVREPERVEDLHDLLGLFDLPGPEPGVDAAAVLFLACSDPDTPMAPERPRGALSFAVGRVRPGAEPALLDRLGPLSARLARQEQPDLALGLLRFLLATAKRSGAAEHRRLVFEALLELICAHPGRPASADVAPALVGLQEVELALPEHMGELAAPLLVAPGNWKRILASLRRAPAEVLLRLTPWVVRLLRVVGRTPVSDQPELADWLDLLIRPGRSPALQLAPLLAELAREPAELVGTCRILAELLAAQPDPDRRDASVGQVGAALRELLTRRLVGPEAMGLRKALQPDATVELLLAEYRAGLEQSGDPKTFLRDYEQQVLAGLPDYASRYRRHIVLATIRALPDREQLADLEQHAQRASLSEWPEPDLRWALERLDASVTFDPADRRSIRLAPYVCSVAATRNIALRLNRAALRGLATQLAAVSGAGRRVKTGAPDQELRQALDGIGATEYRAFLVLYLPVVLRAAGSAEQHRAWLRAALVSDHRAAFRAACGEVFERPCHDRRQIAQLAHAAVHWTRLAPADGDDWKRFGVLQRDALDAIARSMRVSDESVRQGLDDAVTQRVRTMPDALERWRQVARQGRRGGWSVKRLLSLLGLGPRSG